MSGKLCATTPLLSPKTTMADQLLCEETLSGTSKRTNSGSSFGMKTDQPAIEGEASQVIKLYEHVEIAMVSWRKNCRFSSLSHVPEGWCSRYFAVSRTDSKLLVSASAYNNLACRGSNEDIAFSAANCTPSSLSSIPSFINKGKFSGFMTANDLSALIFCSGVPLPSVCPRSFIYTFSSRVFDLTPKSRTD
jgi:hypothetical protein